MVARARCDFDIRRQQLVMHNRQKIPPLERGIGSSIVRIRQRTRERIRACIFFRAAECKREDIGRFRTLGCLPLSEIFFRTNTLFSDFNIRMTDTPSIGPQSHGSRSPKRRHAWTARDSQQYLRLVDLLTHRNTPFTFESFSHKHDFHDR